MFIAIISDTYGEIKEELVEKNSDIQLAKFFKKGLNNVLSKIKVKQTQVVDIKDAITFDEIKKDRKIEFVEFRNSLRVGEINF